MFLKCPRCKEREVLEREIGNLTWERTCEACEFKYVISAVVVEQWSLEKELEQLSMSV